MPVADPVKPEGLAMLFVYVCPYCQNEVVFVAPTRPMNVTCGACRNAFPIVPVDERTVQYVMTILGDGKAAVDPSY